MMTFYLNIYLISCTFRTKMEKVRVSNISSFLRYSITSLSETFLCVLTSSLSTLVVFPFYTRDGYSGIVIPGFLMSNSYRGTVVSNVT